MNTIKYVLQEAVIYLINAAFSECSDIPFGIILDLRQMWKRYGYDCIENISRYVYPNEPEFDDGYNYIETNALRNLKDHKSDNVFRIIIVLEIKGAYPRNGFVYARNVNRNSSLLKSEFKHNHILKSGILEQELQFSEWLEVY